MSKDDGIKKKLLDEIASFFCEGYCMFYGNKDCCEKCPMTDKMNQLARQNQRIQGQRIKKRIKFCDDCVHFRPVTDETIDKPNEELCEFVRPLRFHVGIDDYNGENTGFFLPGCKDFTKAGTNY